MIRGIQGSLGKRSSRDAGEWAGRKFEVETTAAAAMVGVPVHTIRNWASRGYLQPLRADGTRTIYSADDVARVAARFGYLPDLREEQDQQCCAPSCKWPSWPDVPVPLCYRHAIAIWLHVGDEWNRRLHSGRSGWQEDGEWDPASDRAGSQQPVVYFVQVGELVKIGTTTTMPRRLAELRSHAQHEPRVLLVVPGSYAEEEQVHALFAADRVRGEWFTLSAALEEFMAERHDQDIRNVHGPLLAR